MRFWVVGAGGACKVRIWSLAPPARTSPPNRPLNPKPKLEATPCVSGSTLIGIVLTLCPVDEGLLIPSARAVRPPRPPPPGQGARGRCDVMGWVQNHHPFTRGKMCGCGCVGVPAPLPSSSSDVVVGDLVLRGRRFHPNAPST